MHVGQFAWTFEDSTRRMERVWNQEEDIFDLEMAKYSNYIGVDQYPNEKVM